MSYLTKVGSFNIDTTKLATETQTIAGVGFEPKIVFLWWSGSLATGDAVGGGTLNFGFGAGISSSSRFCVGGFSADAAATSDTVRFQSATSCIRAYVDGTPTVEGIADFDSMNGDGFVLMIDDQFANAYRVSYLAIGGTDLTNVYIGNKATPAVTGNYTVTGATFQPDAVIMATQGLTAASSVTSSPNFSLGWATGASNQGVVHIRADDNQDISNTYGYGYNGECVSIPQVPLRNAFVQFDADGFTLNNLEGSEARYFHYVCLKGGQYSVGELTTRTDGADIAETVGFQPLAVMFASVNRALSTQDTMTVHTRMSVGAGTSASNRAVQAVSDEDELATTETATGNYDSAVYAHVADDAIVALMDIKSIESTGFTCVMDDTEAVASWVTYLAMGATTLLVNVSDTVGTAETVAGYPTFVFLSVNNAVGVTDTVGLDGLATEDLNASSSSTVAALAETVVATVGTSVVNVSNAAGVTDTNAVTVGTSVVNVSNAVGAADSVTANMTRLISVSDTIGTSEAKGAIVGTSVVAVTEAIGLAETLFGLPLIGIPIEPGSVFATGVRIHGL